MKINAPALGALLALSLNAAAMAQQAPLTVRGSVAAVNETLLTLDTAGGKAWVGFEPSWTAAMVKRVSANAIRPGDVIGVAEIPVGDGAGEALEVHIFADGRSMGEGHYAWDLRPDAMMTSGRVDSVTKGKRGARELEVAFPGGRRHITVPSRAPVVQLLRINHDQVKYGASAFAVVERGRNGGLSTDYVIVGAAGSRPPM